MSKFTKFAQRITPQKRWRQKLLFWRKYYQSVSGVAVRTYPPYAFNGKAKLYRQKDQKAKVIYNIENECDFIGNLPSAGLEIESGIFYWIVFQKKDFKS